jgi:ubiquitin-protein ligase
LTRRSKDRSDQRTFAESPVLGLIDAINLERACIARFRRGCLFVREFVIVYLVTHPRPLTLALFLFACQMTNFICCAFDCLYVTYIINNQERSKLEKEPLEFIISIEQVGDDMYKWDCTLAGPPTSPYAGGKFVLRLEFPAQYPFKAPLLKFVTPVYHPSVQTATGEVCQAVLGNWGPTLNAQHCLVTVYSMLQDPQVDHPLEEEIAQQLSKKPKEFEKTAKKYTKEHAK